MLLINRILNLAFLISSDYKVEMVPLTEKKSKLRALSKIIHHLTWYSFPSGYVMSEYFLTSTLYSQMYKYACIHTYIYTHISTYRR